MKQIQNLVRPFFLIAFLFVSSTMSLELNIAPTYQQKNLWCWNAACEMVLKYYGTTKTQSQIATWVFGSEINQTAVLFSSDATMKRAVNNILKNYANLAIGQQYFSTGTLSVANIFAEIDKKSPIFIGGKIPSGFHLRLIIGYVNDSETNPQITYNDPDYDFGGKYTEKLTWVQKTTGEWEWIETLRLQKSGVGGTGIFDGASIANTTFTYTEPAVVRTYTGNFVRSYGSVAKATQWSWTLSFSHSSGDYVAAFFNDPNYPTLSTTWNAPSFILPTSYAWNYTNDGAVVGKLKLTCIDTDGYYHEDKKDVFYYPPNPYPMSVVYAYSSLAGSSPEIKAHKVIVLQDYQINSGANITFKAGETIEIRDNVTIQNGSISNFIIDPSVR